MSHKIIRKDKTCLNCRHVVENKFCPNCGQENADTRKTFHHLFVHFFEDLTHYENAFWRTIKNLLFKPAALTKEYLSGKRLSYLAPVRLYIFISFLTFFLISVLPGASIEDEILNEKREKQEKKDYLGVKVTFGPGDTINNDLKKQLSKDELKINEFLASKEISDSTKIKLKNLLENDKKSTYSKNDAFKIGFKTIQELDSAKANGKVTKLEYWVLKKAIKVKDNNTKEELIQKGFASFKSNFPKVLIIYMPIFAFFLWLFHSKKQWYYFDHGIFTLHYFSFLLIIFLITNVLLSFIELAKENVFTSTLSNVIEFIGNAWMFYYFFPAHHRFYGESRKVSFVKSIVLFFINMFLIVVILTVFSIYTLINIK